MTASLLTFLYAHSSATIAKSKKALPFKESFISQWKFLFFPLNRLSKQLRMVEPPNEAQIHLSYWNVQPNNNSNDM